MHFLDVCHNPTARDRHNHPVPYLLIVQGDHVDVHRSKIVVPLMRVRFAPVPIRDVMPIVSVLGEPLVAMTPEMAAVAVSEIGAVVASLSGAHFTIRRAIDVLTGDF